MKEMRFIYFVSMVYILFQICVLFILAQEPCLSNLVNNVFNHIVQPTVKSHS